jgi:methylated-DNA-[protein]-cysteine S-methyltransferase
MIDLARRPRAAFEQAYEKRFGTRPQEGKIPEPFKIAVVRAAAGRTYDPVPVDLSGLPDFQAKVLKELQKLPRGMVETYAGLAKKAGRPMAARVVGNAMAKNPIPFLVPCHRVVPSSGGTGNFGFGKACKIELLQLEGVKIESLR